MADLKTRPQMDRPKLRKQGAIPKDCLLYTSDAADEL